MTASPVPTPTELPSFVHPLSDGLTASDDDWRFSPDVQAEVDAKCEEIQLARARAEVSGRGYIIY